MTSLIKERLSFTTQGLAVFRICLGIVAFLRALSFFPHRELLFSDSGLLPHSAWLQVSDSYNHSLFSLSDGILFVTVLYLLRLGLSLLFTVGWKTRWVTPALFILEVSFHHRNWFSDLVDSVLIIVFIFLCIFFPVGEQYSLEKGKSNPPVRKYFSGWNIVLLILLFFMYFQAFMGKLNPSWLEGDALLYYFRDKNLLLPFGNLFAGYPEFLRILNYLVIFLEGPFALFIPLSLLFFPRLRFPVAGVFLTFHLLTVLSFQLGFVPWICAVTWIPFLFLTGDKAKIIPGRTLRYIAAFFAVIFFLLNLNHCFRPPFRLPGIDEFIKTAGLYHRFRMFRDPLKEFPVVQVFGEDIRGKRLILLSSDKLDRSTRAAYFGGLMNLRTRKIYLQYFCREGMTKTGLEIDFFSMSGGASRKEIHPMACPLHQNLKN